MVRGINKQEVVWGLTHGYLRGVIDDIETAFPGWRCKIGCILSLGAKTLAVAGEVGCRDDNGMGFAWEGS